MSDTYLIAPVQLDAMVLNQAVLKNVFRWWDFDYTLLNKFESPEPIDFGGGNDDAGTSNEGVYLHWTLPRALRHGMQNRETGSIEYPLVPNRWMILRFGETTPMKGWVLESDCPYVYKNPYSVRPHTSMYLIDPAVLRMWEKGSDDIRRKVSFLDKNGNPVNPDKDPLIGYLGIPFPLESWKEQAADSMFLTAMAPANDVFSMYYKHNAGVFSFFDDLQDINKDTLSYQIVGWYSDAQKDIMASWQQQPDPTSPSAYQDLLDSLQWTVAGGSEEQATASLYEGMVFSVNWDRTSDTPPSPIDPLTDLDLKKINVSIGNTTIDALTAMVETQKGCDARTRKLLEAFQYDLLPVLNQVNGEALLDEKKRQAWYGSKPGGYLWRIVPKESDGDTSADLTDDEKNWLLQLNKDQSDLDKALGDLYALQWELNAAWYRNGYLSAVAPAFLPGIGKDVAGYIAKLKVQLDPAASGSIASQVISQIELVRNFLGKVPQPDLSSSKNRQTAFRNGILAFANQKGLPAAVKTLKAVAAPRYWKPNNPVIFISGIEPSPAINPTLKLKVRLVTDVVTGFLVGAQEVDAAAVEQFAPTSQDLANLPAPLSSLVQEYFLLNPAGATAIAEKTGKLSPEDVKKVMSAHNPSDYKGTLPELNLEDWSQPWSPLFMEWKANYNYIPTSNDSPAWTFDGTDYHYTPENGNAPPEIERSLSGIILLSAHSQFLFSSRLKKFVEQFAAQDDELKALVEEAAGWQFLSQELTGFNEQLILRSSHAYRRPVPADVIPLPSDSVSAAADEITYSLAELIGYGGDAPPTPYSLPDAYKGQVSSVPLIPVNSSVNFHGVRQGQMYFTDLIIYDQFGRALNIIESGGETGLNDYKNFDLVTDEAFKVKPITDPPIEPVIDPPIKLITDPPLQVTSGAVAQLPPRLLQFARLDFDLVDGKTDSEILGLDLNANPVCGWVLPNHLDGSILIYAPDGKSLGEFRLVENDLGAKVAEWQSPPHSLIKTLGDVALAAPRLAQMIEAASIKEEANFKAFLEAIDTTLWTIDRLGNRADRNLSVLIGRPLALLRARLRFRLDGPAVKDTGWASAINPNPPDPEFLSCEFAVRLGDQATREDGLIGYFLEENQTTSPPNDQTYKTFNSVVAPETTAPPQDYVKQIGPLGINGGSNYIPLKFEAESEAYVSLLADPRAAIHAVTGILPVKQLDIPPEFVDQPLAHIEVSFRIGPLLTSIQPTPAVTPPVAAEYPTAIAYPFPAEQNGQWSWWEADADGNFNNPYELLKTTPDAKLKSTPNTLRDGILQLILDKDS